MYLIRGNQTDGEVLTVQINHVNQFYFCHRSLNKQFIVVFSLYPPHLHFNHVVFYKSVDACVVFFFFIRCCLVVCCFYVQPSVIGQNFRRTKKQRAGETSNWSIEDKHPFKGTLLSGGLIRKQVPHSQTKVQGLPEGP